MTQPFDPYLLDIDGSPRGGLFLFFKKVRLCRFALQDPPDLFPADPLFLIQTGKLPDGRYNPLARASCCPDRLHQGPVSISLTIHLLVMSTQIHEEHII
jgi:hypothetical protein